MTAVNQKHALSRKIVDLINHLPPLPETIIELRKIGSDPNVRFSKIIPVLKKDPPLCADLLHLVNSAYFGLNNSVNDIGQALRIFGVEPLINFITLSFSEKAIKKYFAKITNLNKYFQHSRQISKVAALLAKKAKKDKKTQEFVSIAGLLHDIGRLIIMLAEDKNSFELAGNSIESLQDIIKDEQDITGMNHCVIGSTICDKWSLSKLLQKTIQYHHTPLENGIHSEAGIIYFAHFITFEEVSDMMLATALPQSKITEMGLSPKALIAAKKEFTKLKSKQKI